MKLIFDHRMFRPINESAIKERGHGFRASSRRGQRG